MKMEEVGAIRPTSFFFFFLLYLYNKMLKNKEFIIIIEEKKKGGKHALQFDEYDKIKNGMIAAVNSYVNEFVRGVDDLDYEEFNQMYISLEPFLQSHNLKGTVSTEHLLILIALRKCSKEELKNVWEYLNASGYGWQDDKYILSNKCLRNIPNDTCKSAAIINTPELTEKVVGDIYKLFGERECGGILITIFSYCVTSIFCSRLNNDNLMMPYYLQIACNRGTVIYQMIEEIVDICSVNSGLIQHCSTVEKRNRGCEYVNQTYYPTQSTSGDIENLIRDDKDTPIIIDGHENVHYYTNLLREIVNISNKKKKLGIRERFNVLPVFVCQTIKASFNNVMDMDLTELDIDKAYLEVLKRNKRMLASWVLELVLDSKKFLFPDLGRNDYYRTFLYSRHIGEKISFIERKYSDLPIDSVKNVAFLSFFMQAFFEVIRSYIRLDKNEDSFGQSADSTISKDTLIDRIIDYCEKNIVNLHREYLPAPEGFGINNREAINLARRIETCYKTLKVFVHIIPYEVKTDRFIFKVMTLQNTKDVDVVNNQGTVQHRLEKYDYFRVDLRDSRFIKLIVAERMLTDNSLLEMFQDKKFTDSSMKIPYAVGYDDTGEMCIIDLDKLEHLLLAGTTNSGKSTALKSLLLSIAYKHRTGDVQVVIMDLLGKVPSDFDPFKNSPFLACPVITDPQNARNKIRDLQREMRERLKSKNLDKFPAIICVIDEFPKLFDDLKGKKVCK